MLRTCKYVALLLIILISSCVEETHYDNNVAESGTGLPIEVNENLIIMAIDDLFVENYDTSTGTILIDSSQPDVPVVKKGSVVILGLNTAGVLRRVVDIIQEGENSRLVTEQANLEDVFIDGEFKLSTDFLEVNVGKNNTTISKDLTDADGFIHPYEIVYHTKEGDKISKKSSEYSKSNGDPIDLDFNFGQSLHTIIDYSGEVIYTKDDKIDISIDSGYVEFAPVFKFELKFESPKFEINWRNIKIKRGELVKLKFFADKAKFDFKTYIKAVVSEEYNNTDEIIFGENILSADFLFVIAGVPVYITVGADMNISYDINFNAASEATAGYRALRYLTYGYQYENGGWSHFKEVEKYDLITPLVVKGNLEMSARVEMYPRFELKLYDVIGPTMKIVPFLDAGLGVGYNSSISKHSPWVANVDVGLDLRGGLDVSIFGWEKAVFPELNFNVATIPLYSSPDTLFVNSGNAQTQNPNKTLPNNLSIKVLNNLDVPVKGVPVFFSSEKGEVEHISSLTDENGIASISFVTPDDLGTGYVNASIKNNFFEDIKNTSFSYNVVVGDMPKISAIRVVDVKKGVLTLEYDISDEGGTPVTNHGLVWTDIVWGEFREPPSIEKHLGITPGAGSGIGTFTVSIPDLKRGTPYYIRAYATNDADTNYSEEIGLTTKAELATVEINYIDDKTASSAVGYAKIIDDGGSEIKESGFIWSKDPSLPTYENNDGMNFSNINTIGDFNVNIYSLAQNTKYNVKAFVINSEGIAYSSVDDLLTLKEITEVDIDLNSVIEKNDGTVVASVSINDDGSDIITESGIFWSEEPNNHPTYEENDGIYKLGQKSEGDFEVEIEDLELGVKYYVKAFAINSKGVSPSSTFEEITRTGPVSNVGLNVTTSVFSEGINGKVTLNGIVNDNGGSPISTSWFKYGDSGILQGEAISNDPINGDYSADIGKDVDKDVYYKFYATNEAGKTAEGNEKKIPKGGNVNPPLEETIAVYPQSATTNQNTNLWTSFVIYNPILDPFSPYTLSTTPFMKVGRMKLAGVGVGKTRSYIMFDLGELKTTLGGVDFEINSIVCRMIYTFNGDGLDNLDEDVKIQVGEMDLNNPQTEESAKVIWNAMDGMDMYLDLPKTISKDTENNVSIEFTLNSTAMTKLKSAINNSENSFNIGLKLDDESLFGVGFRGANEEFNMFKPKLTITYTKK